MTWRTGRVATLLLPVPFRGILLPNATALHWMHIPVAHLTVGSGDTEADTINAGHTAHRGSRQDPSRTEARLGGIGAVPRASTMPPAQSRSIDDRGYWRGSKVGAALVPIGSAAPTSTWYSPIPRPGGRGRHFYNDLWLFGGRKPPAAANYCGLLPSDHIPCGAPLLLHLRADIGQRTT